jgi:hypothetical protein
MEQKGKQAKLLAPTHKTIPPSSTLAVAGWARRRKQLTGASIIYDRLIFLELLTCVL